MPGGGWRSQKVRRPGEVIAPLVRALSEELASHNPGLEFYVAGSWRRGAPVIGDLDVVCVNTEGRLAPDLFSSGVVLPAVVSFQRLGEKIAQGDLTMPDGGVLHIDFWSCTPAQRGAFLCFATGPAQLNLYQRRLAVRHGMGLSQIGLLDRITKRQLDDGTERDIYARLRMTFLTPEERQRWARP